MDENVRHEAEQIAGSLGCDMKQLNQELLKIILRTNGNYTNEEQFDLMKRFAAAGVVPEHYIDGARALLFLDLEQSLYQTTR